MKLLSNENIIEVIRNFKDNKNDNDWSTIQNQYWFLLKGLANKMLHNDDLAFEAIINTFRRAFENIDKYDDKVASFGTWLYSICRNECLIIINAKKNQRLINQDISDLHNVSGMKKYMVDHDLHPSDNIVYANNRFANQSYEDNVTFLYNRAIEEINNLPKIRQEIVTMKLLDGLKISEIAEYINRGESYVKNNLYVALRRIEYVMSIKYAKQLANYNENLSA